MKYCSKCGNEICENDLFCKKCGYKYNAELNTETKTQKTLILSIVLLFCVTLLPMYNSGLFFGEIYPTRYSYYFWDVIEMMFEYSDWFEIFSVQFTIFVLVCGVALLFSSTRKNKMMCIISSIFGIGGMMYQLSYFIRHDGADNVFSFSDTPICMGFWLVLILFIWSFCESVKSNSDT